MAGDVLRGNSAASLGEGSLVARLLGDGEFALRVSVEIGSIAVEGEHEQEFGVQARGRRVVGGEAGDCRGEGRLQLHVYISTQSGRGRWSSPAAVTVIWVPFERCSEFVTFSNLPKIHAAN